MSSLLPSLIDIVGSDDVILPSHVDATQYLTDSRGRVANATPLAIIFPQSIEILRQAIRFCWTHNIITIPQGGNTGRCAGALPLDIDGDDVIIINSRHLNRIISIDQHNASMEVEAGVILHHIQQYAKQYNLLFPLSMGSEGTCQIGGNIATNAGGMNVLRYGNCRDQILGLEIITPQGDIIDMMNGLRKNNTGLDLKQLYIGSEGILGFITKAVLKLQPLQSASASAMVAIDDANKLCDLFFLLREKFANELSICEFMPAIAINTACAVDSDLHYPMEKLHDWTFWIKIENSDNYDEDLKNRLIVFLSDMVEKQLICDGVIAQSEKQANLFHRFREVIVDAQKSLGYVIKNDISLKINDIPAFLNKAQTKLSILCPDIKLYAYGHFGDGNIHFNLSKPDDISDDMFKLQEKELHYQTQQLLYEFGGSFSAEHGIGRDKVAAMTRYKPPLALDMMRSFKQMVDSKNLFNRGAVL